MRRKPNRLYPGERVRVNGTYSATVVFQIEGVVRLRPDGAGEESHDLYDYTIIRRLEPVGARAHWWRRLAARHNDERLLNELFKASFDKPDRRRAAVEWMEKNGHEGEAAQLRRELGLDNLSMMEAACLKT